MFDVGFSELVVCFIIALVVLGPERLPAVARTIGRWTGQARGYMRNLTNELERETRFSELQRQLDEAKKAAQMHSQQFNKAVENVATEVKSSTEPQNDGSQP